MTINKSSMFLSSAPTPAQDCAHAGRPSAVAAGAHITDSVQLRGDHPRAVPGPEGEKEDATEHHAAADFCVVQ